MRKCRKKDCSDWFVKYVVGNGLFPKICPKCYEKGCKKRGVRK